MKRFMAKLDARRSRDSEAGFGMVEVIVSLAILAMFAVVLVPVLLSGFQVTNHQTRVAYAAQLVSETINSARDTPTCQKLVDMAGIPDVSTDAQGKQVSVQTALTGTVNCGTTLFPTTVQITVTATGTDCLISAPMRPTCTLSKASTNILVRG
jgi:type II secretory pathway pseudopilin PulG